MTADAAAARVVAVAAHAEHAFSKPSAGRITLLSGLGVAGDAHCGVTVKHRSRVARDPSLPNLRQVHLLQAELFDALAAQGLALAPGELGENITTRGVDLLALPAGTRVHLGAQAVVVLTGLRNPCAQIEAFRPGLLAAVLPRGADGQLQRRAGVMGVVLQGGAVAPGDALRIEPPAPPHRPLERV